jgi:hypothetical protein
MGSVRKLAPQTPATRTVLAEIALVAGVPSEHRSMFCDRLQEVIDYAWSVTDRQEKRGRASDLRSAPKRIARDAATFAESLQRTSAGAGVEIERYLDGAEFRASAAVVENLRQAAEYAARHPTRLGRQRRIHQTTFIAKLRLAVGECNGRPLTFDKNRAGGTLAVALERLTPFLPTGFKSLSPATIARRTKKGSRR